MVLPAETDTGRLTDSKHAVSKSRAVTQALSLSPVGHTICFPIAHQYVSIDAHTLGQARCSQSKRKLHVAMRQRQLVVTNRSTLVPILYFWHAELLTVSAGCCKYSNSQILSQNKERVPCRQSDASMSFLGRIARDAHRDLSHPGDRLRYPIFSNADAACDLGNSVSHSLRYVPPPRGTACGNNLQSLACQPNLLFQVAARKPLNRLELRRRPILILEQPLQ